MFRQYILIGAYIVPTKHNINLFIRGDIDSLIGKKLKEINNNATLRIYNLETPLADTLNLIKKHGPNLIAPTTVIKGYKALNIDLLTLANNHILDQGVDGLISTLSILNQYDIAHIGAGKNLEDASKPQIYSFANKTIGVYACAEHEFSIATENTPGANPFDALYSLDHITTLKTQCDFVIVLYHGGKEYYRYPSPNLQKVCHRLVDKGANLVVCQHSHCIGCEERYKNGIIVYGQGNFIFDGSNNEFWQTSLLISINDQFEISYFPISKHNHFIQLAEEKEGKSILNNFYKRSEEIKTPEFIEKKYKEFSSFYLPNYLSSIQGHESFLFRLCNKMLGNYLRLNQIKKKYDEQHLLALRNYIECEAHKELLLMGINEKLY